MRLVAPTRRGSRAPRGLATIRTNCEVGRSEKTSLSDAAREPSAGVLLKRFGWPVDPIGRGASPKARGRERFEMAELDIDSAPK